MSIGERLVTESLERRTRIAAYGLALVDQRILLSRYASPSPDGGFWNLPGGGLEFGEHPEDAMVREFLEETGLQVRATGLLGFDSITGEGHDHDFHHIRFVYEVEILGGELRPEVNGSSDACEWHNLGGMDDIQQIELIEVALEMYGDKQGSN